MDPVARRVKLLIGRELARAYDVPRTVAVPWCGCGHADDEHHGAAGELHCSVCTCGAFALAEVRESA